MKLFVISSVFEQGRYLLKCGHLRNHYSHQVYKRMLVCAFLIIVSACSLTPQRQTHAIIENIESIAQYSKPDEEGKIDAWWLEIGGQELDDLVTRLLSDSLTLKEARLRAQQATLNANITKAQRIPSLYMSTDISQTRRQDLSGEFVSSKSYGAGIIADFSADVFGGLRASHRAAKLNAMAAELNVIANEQIEIATLARAWVSANTLLRRLNLAKSIAESFKVTYELTNKRYAAGSSSVTASDVQIALQNLESALVDIPSLNSDLAQQLLLIDELTARMPGSTSKEFNGGFRARLNYEIPLGVPAQMLRTRPDVAIAELSYLAALEDVGAARANLYPSLSMSASLSFQAEDASDLFDWDRHIASLANSLLAPIFQGGRLRSQMKLARAQAQELSEAFARSALSAMIDVELALAEIVGLELQIDGLHAALKTAQTSNQITQNRYQQGLTSLLAVLETQRSLNSVQSNIILNEQAMLNAKIDLALSLGGNWHSKSASEIETKNEQQDLQ